VNTNHHLHESLRRVLQKPTLERKGIQIDTGAPVTGAVAISDCVAASFGDGTIRFFRPGLDPTVVQAHRGVVLCLAAGRDCIFTGGDDSRFLKVSLNGQVEEVSNFGTKWVDCIAVNSERYACSSGRTAFVWSAREKSAIELEHPSTVGGLAFDTKGKRLAVAHYGGVTVWEFRKHQWKKSRLVWQGSHGAVTFSPDGKFIISAMQENALHGWRLRGKIDLAMDGYPAKVKSLTWVGNAPYLVTAGADEAICWPFDGPKGPMNRSPVCVAGHGKNIATCVKACPSGEAVFVGFNDGAVLLAELDESKDSIVLKGSSGAEVTAIAATKSRSHLFIGDAKGQILWAPLKSKITNL